MNNKFLDYYKTEAVELNKYISEFNEKIVKEDNQFIKENLEVFKNLNADGKLVRGTLVNLGYKIAKEGSNYSYPLATAFEIFQTSILIHDDIIDHDDLRRGKPTIHSYNGKKYYELTKSNLSYDLGNSIAICMGDLGFYEANKIIASNYKDNSKLGDILNFFSDIVIKTIKGELLDVITPFVEEKKLENKNLEETIYEVYKLKTAYYTIVGPLSLGLLLGGIEEDKLKDVEDFGIPLGVAFQLQDDLLGIYGDNIGKVIGSDIKEFKTTLLYSITKENTELYNELLNYYGKEVNIDNVNRVREIFEESKAKEKVESLIDDMYKKSVEKIDSTNWIKAEDKEILIGLVEHLKSRKK